MQRIFKESEYDNAEPGRAGIWDAERCDWPDWDAVKDQYMGQRTLRVGPDQGYGNRAFLIDGLNMRIVPDRLYPRFSWMNDPELYDPVSTALEKDFGELQHMDDNDAACALSGKARRMIQSAFDDQGNLTAPGDVHKAYGMYQLDVAIMNVCTSEPMKPVSKADWLAHWEKVLEIPQGLPEDRMPEEEVSVKSAPSGPELQ